MSRVPALPNLFAPRELPRSPVLLVIARLGIRESFAVVRTRLPLALVLNYGGPPSFSASTAKSPSAFIRAHAAVSETRKSTTKVAVPPSYTGLVWKYDPWVHYDGNSRLAIHATMAERIESVPLCSPGIYLVNVTQFSRYSSHEIVRHIDRDFSMLIQLYFCILAEIYCH